MTNLATERDTDLLRRYATEGSEEAFAELVQRHIALVHTAALRQVGDDPAEASDVTQSAFVELARNASRLSGHPAVAGWLYTTTRRMAAHAIRATARRRRREEANHMQDAGESSVEPDWVNVRPVLDDAMHDLREADRLAILWRYFEEKPLQEIGSRLGLSENAARMRVERALEKLRARLDKRGIKSTAAALGLVLATRAVASAPPLLSSTVAAAARSAASTAFASSGWTFGSAVNSIFNIYMTSKCVKCAAIAIILGMGYGLFAQRRFIQRLKAERAEVAEQAERWRMDSKDSADAAQRELLEAHKRKVEAERLAGGR